MSITTITPHDLYRRMKLGHNVIIVDIRSQYEFAKGHIPGATFYPLEIFDADALIHKACVPFPDKPTIYVCCANGSKSQEACQLLADEGYEYIVFLKGGMKAWNSSGLPLNKIYLPPSAHQHLQLKQQSLIAIGLTVTVGTLLGTFVNVGFLAICLIAGIGAIYEGLFGTDYIKQALLKMSWNKKATSL
jgi:rhodanese-related sulfurtransferase